MLLDPTRRLKKYFHGIKFNRGFWDPTSLKTISFLLLFQLVAVTCILIASKLEEYYPSEIDELVCLKILPRG